METTLEQIIGKENDFKLCWHCKKINWYENEICHACGNKKFRKAGAGIIKYIDDDYKFYREEGYEEEEIDRILVDI